MLCVKTVVLTLGLLLSMQPQSEACVSKPWEDGLINEQLLTFKCSSGHYLECDDPRRLENNIEPNFSGACGVILNCSSGSMHNRINIGPQELAELNLASEFVIKADNCGLNRVVLHFGDQHSVDEIDLHLSKNLLDDLSDIYLGSGPRLRTLNISGNLLETLSSVDLGLHFVQVADFSFNAIKQIDAGYFSKFENMKWLSFANNNLTAVPKLNIRDASSVTVILRSNAIFEIEANAFENVKFDLLDISDNVLPHITKAMFTVVGRVTTLRLSDNRINWIQAGSFAENGVTFLDLSGNSLGSVSLNVFSNLPALEYLTLSDNRIQTVESPDAFENCTKLEYLNLSNNILRNIPSGAFRHLSSLRTLVLSSNRITTLGSNSFEGLRLSLLDLSSNLFQTIEETSFRDTQAEHLDFSNCELLEFPLQAVRVLGESVRELNLSRNSIDTFPNVNHEKALPLETLDLSYNLIHNINCSWLGDDLGYLFLHHNNISSIERCLPTERIFSLAQFSLRGNPLDCCSLKWLHDVSFKKNTLRDAADTTCETLFRKHFWREAFVDTEEECLQPEDEDGEDTEDCGSAPIVAAVLGTLFGMLLLLAVIILIVYVLRKIRKRKEPSINQTEQRTELPVITENVSPGYETAQRPIDNPVDTYETILDPISADCAYVQAPTHGQSNLYRKSNDVHFM